MEVQRDSSDRADRRKGGLGRRRLVLRNVAFAAGLAALVGLLSGCSMVDKQATWDTYGEVARTQLICFDVTLWVSLGIFVVVGSLMVFTVFRFHVSGDIPPDAPLPPQTHGNAVLEVMLTLISVALLVVIAVPTIKGIFTTTDVPQTADLIQVNVTGWQWWWQFDYPDLGVHTANELVIPVGHPIQINLKSGDVIHSFWVPKLAGKVDLIPGQHNVMWMKADSSGIYYGQCAQFCGENHANMRLRVHAVYDSDFQLWVANQRKDAQKPPATEALAKQGYNIFMMGPKVGTACSTCHTISGTPANGAIGPNLTHFASRDTMAGAVMPRSDADIALWLTHLNDVKPGNRMLAAKLQLSNDEVKALTAWLDTLK